MPTGSAPSFERVTLGIAKESSFGAAAAPTVWVAPTEVNFNGTNEALGRPGARQRSSQDLPTTGRFTGAGAFSCEATPDVLGALFSLAMGGNETVTPNANNPGSGSPTLAYDHYFTLGPHRSFTARWNRVIDAIDYVGNTVKSLRFSVSPSSVLIAQLTTSYQREVTNASPGTATLGTLEPFRFEDPGNVFTLDTTVAGMNVTAFDISIDTGVQDPPTIFGQGRFGGQPDEGQAKVTASGTIQFNTRALYERWLGNVGATSPQSTITPIVLDFFFRHTAAINAAVQNSLRFRLANCFLTGAPVTGRNGSSITQTFQVMPGQTAPGASDDLAVTLTSAASSAF